MNLPAEWRSVTGLAAAIRGGKLSAAEAAGHFVDAVGRLNPDLRAAAAFDPERVLTEAARSDEILRRDGPAGPLHGVPLTVKDSIDAAEYPCAAGTAGRKSRIPDRDAAAVRRLRGAGAVVLAKTSLPELCMAFESDNLLSGRVANPYDPERSAGGSSGGEAALIAAGASPGGLGSDAGGSIRVPAHFCGIAGLKPTSGRVPRTGHTPPHGGVVDAIWQIGPMAATVGDLDLLMSVIAGPDTEDPNTAPVPWPDFHKIGAGSLRVGVYDSKPGVDTDPSVREAVADAARALAEAGARVEAANPPLFDHCDTLWCKLFGIDGGDGLKHLLDLSGTVEIHFNTRRALERFEPHRMSAAEFNRLTMEMNRVRAGMLAFMRGFDALLGPACAFPAIAHGTSWNEEVTPGFAFTMDYNYLGWPAAVVRAGTSPEGLPIGVQLAAPPWREDIALALAAAVEAMGEWPAPPLSA